MRYLFIVISFLICSVCRADLSAIEQISLMLNAIDNISADFTQSAIKENGQQAPEEKQTGRFVANKQGKFLWEISPPFNQVIVSDGVTLSIYDPDLEQLTLKNITEHQQIIPLQIFSEDVSKWLELYHVNSNEDGSFVLMPKKSGNIFSKIAIYFHDGSPRKLLIEDSLGQFSEIIFDNTAINQKLDASLFELSVPHGTDIIDERLVSQ